MSSVEPTLLFGINDLTQVDSLIVFWENQKMEIIKNPKINQILLLRQKNAQVNVKDFRFSEPVKPLFEEVTSSIPIGYSHVENTYFDFNRELLIPFKVSIEGPKMAVGDVNGDGLEDFYVGGAKYQAGQLFLQKGSGFVPSKQTAFLVDSLYEDVDALFFDADGDKDLDLYVVTGGNEFFDQMPEQFDRLYLNDGKGNFKRNLQALPSMYDNKSVVRPCDFDQDGDMDLFVGGRVIAYHYGHSPRSYLLVNNGKGIFKDVTVQQAPNLREAGMITEAIWSDIDRDGDQDLIVVGDWMPIKMFINQAGKLTELDNDLKQFTGFWSGLTSGDFDRDGDIDFVVGNLGTNTKLRKTLDGQLKMYIRDIDKNDTKEHIIGYGHGDDWYPINSKDELGKQIPSIINKKFTNYQQFAGKSLKELFADGELEGAEEKLINTFESVYIENMGSGKFKISVLPSLAQISKIMVLRTEDVDKDGKLDVIIGGNFDGASMYQARYDAFFGLILKGDGKGRFKALIPTDTGLLLDGDVRDIKTIRTPKGPLYFVTRNNDHMQLFRKIP
jgi:hypothetical protein